MPAPVKYQVQRFDEQHGNRVEFVSENPLVDFRRPPSTHDELVDDEIVDLFYHKDDIYRVYWNRHLFSTRDQLKKLTSAEQILCIIYINNYPQPMIVRGEPTGPNTLGFVGYRHDGKAIIAGTGIVYEDKAEFVSDPVYGKVRFNCMCGAQKRVARPPRAN